MKILKLCVHNFEFTNMGDHGVERCSRCGFERITIYNQAIVNFFKNVLNDPRQKPPAANQGKRPL